MFKKKKPDAEPAASTPAKTPSGKGKSPVKEESPQKAPTSSRLGRKSTKDASAADDGSLVVEITHVELSAADLASASVQVVLIGFIVSSIFAVPLGLFMGTYRIVQSFLDPFVNFMRYLPVTSFVPLFILWIGIGIEQRVTVIIFGIFFQQLVMFADAARSVPRDLVNAAYTLGTSRSHTVFHIVLPATLPNILDILRVTMGWAWTYLVVAELVAARSGLGYISLKAMRGFQVDVIFMAIATIGILGLFTDQIFRVIRRFATPWAV